MSERPVWYAAYGSNLLRARFLSYLVGGVVPNATDGGAQRGARHAAAPSGDRPFELPFPLLFAHSAARWGDGGVAKLGLDHDPTRPTAARAWRITLGQLEDVIAQENRLPAPPVVDLDRCCELGRIEVCAGRYGTLLSVGRIDDEPVLTFTGSTAPEELRCAHTSYLEVIADGLAEMGWSTPDAARYLASCPGNHGELDPEHLARHLARPR